MPPHLAPAPSAPTRPPAPPRLRRTELKQQGAGRLEHTSRLEQGPPDQVQAIAAAVQCLSRLVRELWLPPTSLNRRKIGEVGDDQVRGGGAFEEVPLRQPDARDQPVSSYVAGRHPQGGHVDV